MKDNNCNYTITPSFQIDSTFRVEKIGADSCVKTNFCSGVISGGGGEGDKTFVFTQAVPADRWVIKHGLNKYPSVTVVDTAGSVVIGDVDYIDINNVVVSFNGIFAGKAYLN